MKMVASIYGVRYAKLTTVEFAMLDDNNLEDEEVGDEDEIDDEEREKRQAIKDAAVSSALSKIMAASSRGNAGLSKYEITKKEWQLLGKTNGLEFYLGSICSEVMCKHRKSGRGKIKFWDEHIKAFKGQELVAVYKMKYINGFRESINDAVKAMMLDIAL